MRPAMKANGSKYYEYILLYTDNAIIISENAEYILRNKLGKYFELKPSSIVPPKIYLGYHVRNVSLYNGTKVLVFSPFQYVQAAVKNVKDYLDEQDQFKMPCNQAIP